MYKELNFHIAFCAWEVREALENWSADFLLVIRSPRRSGKETIETRQRVTLDPLLHILLTAGCSLLSIHASSVVTSGRDAFFATLATALKCILRIALVAPSAGGASVNALRLGSPVELVANPVVSKHFTKPIRALALAGTDHEVADAATLV